MGTEDLTAEPDLEAYLTDRTAPLDERLAKAREIAARTNSPRTILVARPTVVDGAGVPDNYVSDEEWTQIIREYGFPGNRHAGNRYDARTPSELHPDLTLQIKEGPIELGGPSEVFPSGQAWSSYDYTLNINIIVSPQH